MFSQVVRSAQEEPQVITVHGEETAVILSMEDYRKLSSPKESFLSFIENSPLASVKLELPERQIDKMRKTGL